MAKIDPERRRQLREEGEAARRNMQEIIDRVDARMRARRERSAAPPSIAGFPR